VRKSSRGGEKTGMRKCPLIRTGDEEGDRNAKKNGGGEQKGRTGI